MDNDSKVREDKKRYKRFHPEQIDYSYDSSEQEYKRHYRMSSAHKKRRTSNYSRSRSRSPREERRYMSQSPKRYQSRYKVEEVETPYPEYYCKACDCSSSGQVSWNQHIVGRRHAKNTGREIPEFYSSSRRNLIETETKPWVHDYVPKEKLMKSDKQKSEYIDIKEYKLFDDVSQNVRKADLKDDNCADFDYILVIHKEDKSFFQCILCDTYGLYKNCQQLIDHVQGVNHQRAFKEEKQKKSIRIGRMKGKKRGKHLVEEWVEQKLPSNTAERLTKKSEENPYTSQACKDSKSFKRITSSALPPNRLRRANNMFRRTIEQVELFNRRLNLKLTSTTTSHPHRRLSTPASGNIFHKNSIPPQAASSPGAESATSLSSINDNSSTELSVKCREKLETLIEPVHKFSIADISRLLLLKFENYEIQKEDLPYLDKVVEQIKVLSHKLKNPSTTLQKENRDVQEDNTTLLIDISNSEEDITAGPNEVLHVNTEAHEESSPIPSTVNQLDTLPAPSTVNQLDTLPAPSTLDQLATSPAPSTVDQLDTSAAPLTVNQLDTSPAPSAVEQLDTSPAPSAVDQLDKPIQPPAAFWNSLPSMQDLENILSNLPNLNLSKNSDGIVEITLN